MSVASVKEHLQSCDKAISYKCLACSKIFGGQFCARNHVKHWHVGYTVRTLSVVFLRGLNIKANLIKYRYIVSTF